LRRRNGGDEVETAVILGGDESADSRRTRKLWVTLDAVRARVSFAEEEVWALFSAGLAAEPVLQD